MTITTLIASLEAILNNYGDLTVKHLREINEDGPDYGIRQDADVRVDAETWGQVTVLGIRSEL